MRNLILFVCVTSIGLFSVGCASSSASAEKKGVLLNPPPKQPSYVKSTVFSVASDDMMPLPGPPAKQQIDIPVSDIEKQILAEREAQERRWFEFMDRSKPNPMVSQEISKNIYGVDKPRGGIFGVGAMEPSVFSVGKHGGKVYGVSGSSTVYGISDIKSNIVSVGEHSSSLYGYEPASKIVAVEGKD